MKGIILAAGRGSRLGRLTEEAPKCLTMLGGKTLLEWQRSAFAAAGVLEVAVVRGYLGERLSQPGLVFFDNPRWSSTNMVQSLMCASDWLASGTCVVSYSDIVYPAETLETLAQSRGDLVIANNTHWRALWEKRFSDPLSDAESFVLNSKGELTEIGQKQTSIEKIQGQYMGLLKFSTQGWDIVSRFVRSLPQAQADKMDMTSLLQNLLSQGVTIHTVPIENRWYEVDTASDLKLCEQEIRSGSSWLSGKTDGP